MAGTVVCTEIIHAAVQEVKWAWTSSAGGAADGVSVQAYSGRVVEVIIIPGGTTPTDLFDVVISDENGVDILLGNGANCPNADTLYVTGLGAVANSRLTLAVTNAGDSKTGTVIVHLD